MSRVESIAGEEVLDSRGRPTVAATCRLEGGATARVSVPSGASTSPVEAVELRDGDPRRYRGLGCRTAAANVSGPINQAVAGRELDQESFDQVLIDLDGTAQKGRLGANALLAASMAFAIARSHESLLQPFEQFARDAGLAPHRLPRPTVNLFSGGLHAGKQIAIQDVLVVSLSARTIDDALAMTSDVYAAAIELTRKRYGSRALVADEGGLAPEFASTDAMLADAVQSLIDAGLRPGVDAALCVDVASTHVYESELYRIDSAALERAQMIDRVVGWIKDFPIVSVEDALVFDDWEGWSELRRRVAGRSIVLADDMTATNRSRIDQAAEAGAADALLLKVNQAGTLSDGRRALEAARSHGWTVTVSARSGETEDAWLSDLAVGWEAEQLKVGSITRSERLAKWNRLLSIERQTDLPIAAWPSR
ncbi:MAG TPA: enolase C-terminal domain-like protein [Candidatus Dormibacteraeota bacterium]|jgi:enolase